MSMARFRAIEFEKNYILEIATVCRGHHVYKKVWKPVTGENSLCIHMNWEDAQEYDDMYLCDDSKQVARHLQIELPFLMSKIIFRKAVVLNSHQLGHVCLKTDHSCSRGELHCKMPYRQAISKKLIDILKTELEKKKLKLAHMKL